ncbi:MAG: hypothetical protein GWO40_05205, partial [Gammaproteobacteria bacterium]|nr:hypothetical protein [Gammaproteobacteria bacterium]NIU03686.1 hypothetical protein [Gammaproteobacteria bacterium]NIX84960.1 hypothetical protein [Gammaproteobacteria bacterium]
MMILAAATLVGGVLSWPTALGGSDRLVTWLNGIMPYEQSRAPGAGSEGTALILMAITLLWSLHFSIVGWVIYAQKRSLP